MMSFCNYVEKLKVICSVFLVKASKFSTLLSSSQNSTNKNEEIRRYELLISNRSSVASIQLQISLFYIRLTQSKRFLRVFKNSFQFSLFIGWSCGDFLSVYEWSSHDEHIANWFIYFITGRDNSLLRSISLFKENKFRMAVLWRTITEVESLFNSL